MPPTSGSPRRTIRKISTAMVTSSGSVKTAPINPSTRRNQNRLLRLALKFVPRLDDFRLVQRHAMQEHELAPAVQPEK